MDDGSTDGSGAAAEALALRRPGTVVLRLSPNRGMGGALRAGFAAAKGRWIATLDADLTFRPEALGEMLRLAEDKSLDLVAGSPYLRREDLGSVPMARRAPSLMMNALYRGLFGLNLSSYTPVFRLYRAARLRELELRSEGFEINAEIAALFQLKRWRVGEIATPLETRVAGVSKLRRGRELARHARLIARLLFGRR